MTTREQIIAAIREAEQQQVAWTLEALAARFQLSKSAINYHVRELRHLGVLKPGTRLVQTDGFVLSQQA